MAVLFSYGLTLTVLGILLVFPPMNAQDLTPDYERLYTNLLGKHQKNLFPASELPVNVEIGVSLIRIVDLIETDEALILDVYLHMIWTDSRLAWDTAQFSNISNIRIPGDLIWRPDITLYNPAGRQPSMFETGAVISKDGKVFLIPQVVLNIHCSLNLRLFPFDTQQCYMKFGSWIYSNTTITLSTQYSSNAIDTSGYRVNPEWELVETSASIDVVKYTCCPEGYPHYQANMIIRRCPGLFTYMFVSPAVLFSLLTPLLFVIPPSSGERTTLGGALLICLLLLLQLLNYHLPPQQTQAPILGIYYTCTMVFVGLALGLTAFIMNVKTRSGRQNGVPGFLRKVVLGPLKRLVFLDADNFRPYGNMTSSGERPPAQGAVTEISHHKMDNQAMVALESEVRDIVKHLKTYNQIRERREIIENIVSDWQEVVLVVDRLLFVIFLVVNIIITMSIFL